MIILGLLTRIRRRRAVPVVVARPGDPKCRAVAVSTGKRCKLDAQPTGFCEIFHLSTPSGPRPA